MLKFDNIETEKHKFYRYKSPFLLEDVGIENEVKSSQISVDEKRYKYSNGYLYDDPKIKPLHLMLPKTNTYVKI